MPIELDQRNDVTKTLYRLQSAPTKTGWYYARRVSHKPQLIDFKIRPIYFESEDATVEWYGFDDPMENWEFYGPVPMCQERIT